jgi:hypothetical protein
MGEGFTNEKDILRQGVSIEMETGLFCTLFQRFTMNTL